MREPKAAKRFFRKLLKSLQYVPRVILTNKLRSYAPEKREVLPGVERRQSRCLNSRVEVLHQPTQSPTFAMFPLPSGTGLGLWSRHTVAPAAAGGTEIAFVAVDVIHVDWSAKGISIAQPPTELDFVRTFVALDPDGHRLRVFAPATP